MTDILTTIEIKNYRNFSEQSPVKLEIRKGITFIIGINNIGKSNLLRFFYELSDLFKWEGINNKSNENWEFKGTMQNTNFGELLPQNSRDKIIYITIKNAVSFRIEIHPQNESFFDTPRYKIILFKNNLEVNFISKEEIPFAYKLFTESLYLGSHRTPFFTKGNNSLYNMSNGVGFVQHWNQWANGPTVSYRNKIKDLVLELRLMLGFSQFTISVNQETMFIHNEYGSFRLDELGAGVSHLIISLGNALFTKPSFIFIDEPENSLHPRLQEEFIRVLSLKSKIGMIATTHSLGLARTMGDQIYTLVKSDEAKFPKFSLSNIAQSHKDVSRSMIEMGFSKYLDQSGSHILLVEGRTDIKVFKELLKKFQIENEVIVLDLGGAEYITDKPERIEYELSEYKRLGAQSYSIILDSEFENEESVLNKQQNGFKNICESLGFKVLFTDGRATENYISQNSLDTFFGKNNKMALSKFESFNNLPKAKKWGKVENWKLFNLMDIEDLDKTKLYDFFLELATTVKKQLTSQDR